MPYYIKVGTRYVGTKLLGERFYLTHDKGDALPFASKLEAARHVRKLYIRRLVKKSQNVRLVHDKPYSGKQFALFNKRMGGIY